MFGTGGDIFDLGVDGDTDVIFDYNDGADTIRRAGGTFLGLSIATEAPGRVQILFNGGTEELIVRDGSAGLLTAADFDPGDVLFV